MSNDNKDHAALNGATADNPHPYQRLVPELVLDAVETFGVSCTGSVTPLNSYENRVYQVALEDGSFRVAKFYRPGRWTNAAILEEHAFTLELAAADLPVVAPQADASGQTLHTFKGFRIALYPRRGGRAPELDRPDNLAWLGRLIGRMHALGVVQPFRHRPSITVDSFGRSAYAYLRGHGFIPAELSAAYYSVVEHALDHVAALFERAGPVKAIRLHGDCHPGNILWTEQGPIFVDFDDCRMGPAVQDLWMLLSGPRAEMSVQLDHILDGYSDFFEFDAVELQLVEALRTLRMLHYSAWLAQRWADPAFPRSFPWFNTPRYWEEQILGLREQLAAMEEPPLGAD